MVMGGKKRVFDSASQRCSKAGKKPKESHLKPKVLMSLKTLRRERRGGRVGRQGRSDGRRGHGILLLREAGGDPNNILTN